MQEILAFPKVCYYLYDLTYIFWPDDILFAYPCIFWMIYYKFTEHYITTLQMCYELHELTALDCPLFSNILMHYIYTAIQ